MATLRWGLCDHYFVTGFSCQPSDCRYCLACMCWVVPCRIAAHQACYSILCIRPWLGNSRASIREHEHFFMLKHACPLPQTLTGPNIPIARPALNWLWNQSLFSTARILFSYNNLHFMDQAYSWTICYRSQIHMTCIDVRFIRSSLSSIVRQLTGWKTNARKAGSGHPLPQNLWKKSAEFIFSTPCSKPIWSARHGECAWREVHQ